MKRRNKLFGLSGLFALVGVGLSVLAVLAATDDQWMWAALLWACGALWWHLTYLTWREGREEPEDPNVRRLGRG
jgi:hypothetical protein